MGDFGYWVMSKKLVTIIALIITAMILGGTLYAVVGSSMEPTIELTDFTLIIKHFYSVRIDRSDIAGVECLTAPIKITARTNGTAAGSTRTGNFTTAERGAVKLYAFGNRFDGSAPYTIIMTRDKPIIIAFSDEARTREIYSRISDWLVLKAMHIGSYDDEPATIAAMEKYATENGYAIDIK